jgi:DNA gyrase subunit B
LNVEKSTDSALYKNEEISNVITALGLGKKSEKLDRSKLRYDRIVILTDADADGAHIRTLLLTFLYRYQPDIFSAGIVHMAVPPLYKVNAGKKEIYCYSDEELNSTLETVGGRSTVQRFKGLGEMMPEQLWQTTMDPIGRRLMRLTVTNAREADRIFKLLMGDVVNPRKEFISNECHRVSEVDI